MILIIQVLWCNPISEIHSFLERTWNIRYGRPNKIGYLLNPEFFNWVQSRLISDIRNEFPNDTQFEPESGVHSDYHWLTPLISNTLSCMSDSPNFVPEDRMQFYIAFERDFDCHELNCVAHATWSIHIKRLDDVDETIGESIDLCCLQSTVEDWIRDFLELRFPAIIFDFDSLSRDDSLPSLNRH